MLKNINFESERLRTYPLVKEDASTLFQFYSDSDAMKYRGSQPMKNISDAHKMITGRLITNDSITKLRLGIKTKNNHELVGTLLLVREEEHGSQFEIGFSFGKDHWGKGYGKETLTMVEKQLQTYQNIKSIKAWCNKENLASVRIFQKSGFTEIQQNEYPKSHLFVKKLQK